MGKRDKSVPFCRAFEALTCLNRKRSLLRILQLIVAGHVWLLGERSCDVRYGEELEQVGGGHLFPVSSVPKSGRGRPECAQISKCPDVALSQFQQ